MYVIKHSEKNSLEHTVMRWKMKAKNRRICCKDVWCTNSLSDRAPSRRRRVD